MDELYQDRAPALRTIQKIYKVCAEGGTPESAEERVQDKRKGSKKKRRTRDDDTIDAVRRLLDTDRRITVTEVASMVGIGHTSAHEITCQDHGLKKISARWVPCLLTEEHKKRVACAEAFLRHGANWRTKIITVDETWVHYSIIGTKSQSKE